MYKNSIDEFLVLLHYTNTLYAARTSLLKTKNESQKIESIYSTNFIRIFSEINERRQNEKIFFQFYREVEKNKQNHTDKLKLKVTNAILFFSFYKYSDQFVHFSIYIFTDIRKKTPINKRGNGTKD